MAKRSPGRLGAIGLFFGGQASEAAMPLVRSIILANLLLPEQFGLAMTLSVVLATANLCLQIGLDRMIVRSPPGQETVRRDTLHTLALLVGVTIAVLLAAAGPLIARVLETPDVAWAFSVLGLAALLRGCANLGSLERARDYVYWPDAVAVGASQICWTVLVAVFSVVLGDYRCMLIGIFGGQAMYVLSSHAVSPYRWRLGFHRETVREAMNYGAPLIPNGIALAAKTLGDRLVVAAFLGLEAMALYSTVVVSALMVRGMIQRVLRLVFLPFFVNYGVDRARETRLFDVFAIIVSVITLTFTVSFMTLGPPVITFVFGENYQPDQLLVGAVAINIAAKLLLAMPVPAIFAYGQTRLILLSTIGGLAGFGLGTAVVILTDSLVWMLLATTVAELVTVRVLTVAVARTYGISMRGFTYSLLLPVLALAGVAAALQAMSPISFVDRLIVFGIAVPAGCAGTALVLKLIDVPLGHIFQVVRSRPRMQKTGGDEQHAEA